MDKELFNQFLEVIRKYYPSGSPTGDLKDILEQKINSIIPGQTGRKAEVVEKWDDLVKKLREKGFQVENRSYLQFPNLLLVLVDKEVIGNIVTYKNFVLCLSLLCPFYTFYHEYTHKVRVNDRSISFNSFAFLESENFQTLKASVPIDEITQLMYSHYPEYKYVNHYPLMINMIKEGIPHGAFETEKINRDFSLYEFLFHHEQPNGTFIYS